MYNTNEQHRLYTEAAEEFHKLSIKEKTEEIEKAANFLQRMSGVSSRACAFWGVLRRRPSLKNKSDDWLMDIAIQIDKMEDPKDHTFYRYLTD
jgi:hypothetical protein